MELVEKLFYFLGGLLAAATFFCVFMYSWREWGMLRAIMFGWIPATMAALFLFLVSIGFFYFIEALF